DCRRVLRRPSGATSRRARLSAAEHALRARAARGRGAADLLSRGRRAGADDRRAARAGVLRRPVGRRAVELSDMQVERIADVVRQGGRLSFGQARELYLHARTSLLGRLADDVRQRLHPDGVVTYIIDRNVNYTNVCVARCRFCAFYRPVGSPEGYTLGFDEIFRKIEETIALGGEQLLLQGGHNPDVPLEWYEDLFRQVKARYPSFRMHALSPPEIIHISRLSHLPP